ncbi:MAG: hypothetical protein AAF657_16720 [Acidobacteriota bacterium]
MSELPDEDLILYYYGEARHADAIRQRLEASPPDRQRYAKLCRLLEQVDTYPVPEVPDDYGARLWRRVQPRLHQPPEHRLRDWLTAVLTPRHLALAGSVAMLLVLAFTAGLYWPMIDENTAQPLPADGRERILRVAISEHLQSSEMLLLELANKPAARADELAEEPGRADALLALNRLYRQTAERGGQRDLAEVLEALERLLIDIAHSDLSPDDLGDLRQRLATGDLLFQIRIITSRVRIDPPPTALPSRGEA